MEPDWNLTSSKPKLVQIIRLDVQLSRPWPLHGEHGRQYPKPQIHEFQGIMMEPSKLKEVRATVEEATEAVAEEAHEKIPKEKIHYNLPFTI